MKIIVTKEGNLTIDGSEFSPDKITGLYPSESEAYILPRKNL